MKSYSAALFLMLCFILLADLQAQSRFYHYNNGPLTDSVARRYLVAQLDVYSVRIRKGSAFSYRKSYLYDRDGRQIFSARFSDTLAQKRLWSSTHHVFAASPGPGSVYRNEERRMGFLRITDYHSDGKVHIHRYYKKSGRLESWSVYTYTDSLLSKIDEFGPSGKLRTYHTYSYYEGRLGQYATYSRKHKLLMFRDYTCDNEPGGKTPSRDTQKICTLKSYRADGSVLTSTHSFNFRGEPVQYRTLQDSLGKTLSYAVYQGREEVLSYLERYAYDGSMLATAYVFNADGKGRPLRSVYKTYNLQGLVIAQADSSFKNNIPEVLSWVFEYNDRGMPVSKSGSENGKLLRTEFYKYRYFRNEQ